MKSHENISPQETNDQEPDQIIAKAIATMQAFRQKLYKTFSQRVDTLMELIDALASNANARSVVELSLSPLFHREYSSVYDAIEHFFAASTPEKAVREARDHEQELLRLIAPFLPKPEQRRYRLFGTDVTYLHRQFAQTLGDRSYVHCPKAIRGNKPVTIGHGYSILSCLPEKGGLVTPPWVVPLIVRRVQSTEKANQVSAEQIAVVVTDVTLPFHDELCALVEDSACSGRLHLGSVAIHPNLVSVICFPGNRVVYRKFELPKGEDNTIGHPTWYGERFDLEDPATWPEPDETGVVTLVTKKGKAYTMQLEGWHDMVRTSKKGIPMHNAISAMMCCI